jgi:hypothetical protein
MAQFNNCHDLKAIQYKTMLIHGKKTNLFSSGEENASNIEKILDHEMTMNKHTSWSRLNKNDKLKKLHEFADTYCKDEQLNVDELKEYLKCSLQRNRLQKVKEINYNKETEKIESIPCLVYNKIANKYTLKRMDKRVSTLSSLGRGTMTRKKV